MQELPISHFDSGRFNPIQLTKVLSVEIPQFSAQETQLSRYNELLTEMKKRKDRTSRDPELLDQFAHRVEVPTKSLEVETQTAKMTAHFCEALPGLQDQVIRRRKESTLQRESIKNLDVFRLSELPLRAGIEYVSARDLWGPIVTAFASDMKDLYQKGVLPRHVVGMRRDFEPFGKAMSQMGLPETPAYVTRKLFMHSDAFDPSKTHLDPKVHLRNLATYMRQVGVTTKPDVALLDSGAWGTLVADIVGLRNVLSHVSTEGLADQLKSVSPQDRLSHLFSRLPSTLTNIVDLEIDANGNNGMRQQDKRRLLWNAVLSDDEVLAELNGRQFTTTAIDVYSHHHDSRFTRPRSGIPSWLHAVGNGDYKESDYEQINDSMEETMPKIYKSPSELHRQEDDTVEVVLRHQDSVAEEIAGQAARLGIQDAVTIHKTREVTGELIHPRHIIKQLVSLGEIAETTSEYTGILTAHTPTWSHGEDFLSNVWPAITEIPESTYYEIDVRNKRRI